MKAKAREEREGCGKQYQEAMYTLASMTEPKLLEKTTWYKGNMKRKKENRHKISDVCVLCTAHSELVTSLRERENKLREMT